MLLLHLCICSNLISSSFSNRFTILRHNFPKRFALIYREDSFISATILLQFFSHFLFSQLLKMKFSFVTFLAAVAIANGSPYTISDERVRSLDVTPVLGRGYSIGTDSFHSTCLVVSDTTTPSYNYDCKCID